LVDFGGTNGSTGSHNSFNSNPIDAAWLGSTGNVGAAHSQTSSGGGARNVLPKLFSLVNSQYKTNGIIAHSSGKRWLRFTFRSDGSSQESGWDINLLAVDSTGSSQITIPAPILVGSPLFVNEADRTSVSVSGKAEWKIGYSTQAVDSSVASGVVAVHRVLTQ